MSTLRTHTLGMAAHAGRKNNLKQVEAAPRPPLDRPRGLGPLMVARTGGLLATRRLMDSVVSDLCRGPGMVALGVCSRASTRHSSKKNKIIEIAQMQI
jgi:hypothetical protein